MYFNLHGTDVSKVRGKFGGFTVLFCIGLRCGCECCVVCGIVNFVVLKCREVGELVFVGGKERGIVSWFVLKNDLLVFLILFQ